MRERVFGERTRRDAAISALARQQRGRARRQRRIELQRAQIAARPRDRVRQYRREAAAPHQLENRVDRVHLDLDARPRALIAGILLLDVGVQGMHISNQSVIYALAGDARSRVTTIYLTSYFIGGALGSFAASVAFGADGWRGVCVAGALIALWVASQRIGARQATQ